MRLHPPTAVRDICATLERAGHEAWCVGGAVRDALLGIATLDWDIATSARPEQVQRLFKRTVPVGIKFGTVGVFGADGLLHEVTTFRHDVETDGRHAVVAFGASLDEDLARRDFTINAIAVHAETLEIRDPFAGRADLERRLLRCVGVAAERMREDRLRALRALRFAGRFDFAIEPDTWRAIVESAPQLGRLSMERVKQELEKVMEQVARPAATIERYREAGIFAALVPVLADAPRARFAALDFLAQPVSAQAANAAQAQRSHPAFAPHPERRLLRLAALFVEPGVAPPASLEQTLKELKFSGVETRATVTLASAAASVSISRLLEIAASDDAVALRRLVAKVGRLMVPGLARLLWARARADGAPEDWRLLGAKLYRRALRSAFRDPLTIADLAVDGEDLQRAGVPPGRAMGETLAVMLERVMVDPSLNTRAALLQLVQDAQAKR